MNKKNLTIGIDIGGTNSAYGFVDNEGNCILESSMPTLPEKPADDLINRLKEKVDEDFKKINDEYNLVGIGIGAPNGNYYKGTVEQPPNLKWKIVKIVEIVEHNFSLPTVVTNDANAAAIGEMKFGTAKGMKDFILITLGTGVGSGIVVNGELVYGADGFAGEIGHTIYDHNGRDCGCGRKGCLETYASASGIKRTVFELLADSNTKSELSKFSFDQLTSKMISDAALRNDKIALEAFDFTGKVLGLQLADSVTHTSPEAIILFGGLALAGDLIFNPTKKYMEENMLNIFKNKVKLLPSALIGGNAAILGAAALIWNELENKKE